jgi:hypothetical protein
LGVEKGFEIWEELGFYEGFGRYWDAWVKGQDARPDDEKKLRCISSPYLPIARLTHYSARTQSHITHLLALIDKFPTSNPSPSTHPLSTTPNASHEEQNSELDPTSPSYDMQRHLSLIRARYRSLCAAMGVKPRPIPASASLPESVLKENFDVAPLDRRAEDVEKTEGGIEDGERGGDGDKKREGKKKVWRVDTPPKRDGPPVLSY